MPPALSLGGVGTPIYATADGIVGRSEWNSGGYGNFVEIDHGQGIQTRYGHLSQRIAQPGQRIRRGDLIGRMGSTGRSTGSHLHYEVRIDGRAVNPVPFMKSTDYLVAMQRKASSGPMSRSLGRPHGAAASPPSPAAPPAALFLTLSQPSSPSDAPLLCLTESAASALRQSPCAVEARILRMRSRRAAPGFTYKFELEMPLCAIRGETAGVRSSSTRRP